MPEHRRLTVPLGKDEWDVLRQTADRDYRHPREQARYLLRVALGLPTEAPGPLARNEGAPLLAAQVGSNNS